MEPATIVRLTQIEGEVRRIEEEKGRQEFRLGLFWEHPPALDPEIVGQAMQRIRDRIRGLEDRKRALLLERQELVVAAAANPPPNPPGNEH